MRCKKVKTFSNGKVFLLTTEDNYLVETTTTHLPYYTKDCTNGNNFLKDEDLGSYADRWMIGVSCMSGCPVRCKFCATGQMKKYRNLTADEIVAQVELMIEEVKLDPTASKEFKINYTRMGEPYLNIEAVKEAINIIDNKYPNTHHYLSTIGVKNSDFSWIKDNITLQISLHSLSEDKRNWLIPFKNKMSIPELGSIRTKSNLKTTINLTLVDKEDFNIDELKKYFNPEYFFIKLSPINPNPTSNSNNMGKGIIDGVSLV